MYSFPNLQKFWTKIHKELDYLLQTKKSSRPLVHKPHHHAKVADLGGAAQRFWGALSAVTGQHRLTTTKSLGCNNTERLENTFQNAFKIQQCRLSVVVLDYMSELLMCFRSTDRNVYCLLAGICCSCSWGVTCITVVFSAALMMLICSRHTLPSVRIFSTTFFAIVWLLSHSERPINSMYS